MKTAYGTKLMNNPCYLRSQSVVGVAVVPLPLPHVRFGLKRFFPVQLRHQVRLDLRSRTENINALLVDSGRMFMLIDTRLERLPCTVKNDP
jgi:hypothetical protein